MKIKSLALGLATLAAFVTLSAQAEGIAPIKSCEVSLDLPDASGLVMLFEIFEAQDGKGLKALLTATEEGENFVQEDTAEFSQHTVRAGLSATTDPGDLNSAEGLVVHALTWLADPELGPYTEIGFDLTQTRSAKVYQIGQATNMGTTAIVEAYDENGALLGSFLGGFLVGACE